MHARMCACTAATALHDARVDGGGLRTFMFGGKHVIHIFVRGGGGVSGRWGGVGVLGRGELRTAELFMTCGVWTPEL